VAPLEAKQITPVHRIVSRRFHHAPRAYDDSQGVPATASVDITKGAVPTKGNGLFNPSLTQSVGDAMSTPPTSLAVGRRSSPPAQNPLAHFPRYQTAALSGALSATTAGSHPGGGENHAGYEHNPKC
jgi:hypothetical protein